MTILLSYESRTKSEVLARLSSYGTITHIKIIDVNTYPSDSSSGYPGRVGIPLIFGVYVKFAHPPDEAKVIAQWKFDRLGQWSKFGTIHYADYSFSPDDLVNSNYSIPFTLPPPPKPSPPTYTPLPPPFTSPPKSTSSSEPTKGQIIIGALVGIGLLTFLAVLLKFPVGILITFGLGGIALAISFNQS